MVEILIYQHGNSIDEHQGKIGQKVYDLAVE